MKSEIRDSIVKRLSEIKKSRRDYYDSNIYSFPDDVVDYFEDQDAIAYAVDDRGMQRVYFAASDDQALVSLLAKFSTDSGIEIISRDVDPRTETALKDSGYKDECVYLRGMNPKLKDTLYDNISEKYKDVDINRYVQPAKISDAGDIYEYIHDVFDDFADHLQTEEEVIRDIENGTYVIHREDNKLMTMTKYVFQGRKVYMEYHANRGESIWSHSTYLYCLEKAVRADINVAYNWVREENQRSLNFCKRFGIVPDGTKNYVFRKRFMD